MTTNAERALFAITAGFVRRWHTSVMLFDENVAAHSWGVATLIAMLHPHPSVWLLKAALFHDITEKKTGDITRWAKSEFPMLARGMAEAEETVEMEYGLFVGLPPEDKIWLDAADLFHAWLFMYRDVMMGNRTMLEDLTRCTRAIDVMYTAGSMPRAFMEAMTRICQDYPGVLKGTSAEQMD